MYTKPDLTEQFAQDATDNEKPQSSTWLGGFLFGEKPPHKWFNWLQNALWNALGNLNERGVLDWDTVTQYNIGSMVWYSGKVYKARQDALTNILPTVEASWQEQSLPDMPTTSNATYALVHNGSQLSWADFKTQDFGVFTGATTITGGISFARSESAGTEPIASEVPVGGLAINLQDKIMYTKKADGTIVPLVSGATRTPYPFTATEGQTTFTPPIGYTVNFLDAYINGRRMTLTDDYTANDGTNVVFNEGLSAGDTVILVVMSTFSIADAYTKTQMDAIISTMRADRAGITFDFAGAIAPTGSLECNGQTVLRADYAELYSAIGDLWATTGGVASPLATEFRLPPQQISGLGLFTRGIGAVGIGVYQADVYKSHNHTFTGTALPTHNHSVLGATGTASQNSGKYGEWGTSTSWRSNGVSSVSAGTPSGSISSNGDATETRPRSITMMKCIWTGK